MRQTLLIAVLLSLLLPAAAFAGTFKVGFAKRDVTPTEPMPMWGYGARHALPGEGTMDPLYAKAVVIDTGSDKLALVGLDLGRSPTFRSMDIIRGAVKAQSGVRWVMMSGSHTHHGPVLELLDREGMGKGKYDAAVAYVAALEKNLIDAINEAAANVVDAKIGWGSIETDFNRNRHTKKEPKPRDPELAVIRFDALDGKTIAVAVNMAAHPTIAPVEDRRWSAEWPGHMQAAVEEALGTNCFFLQGAAGDLSSNTNDERRGIDGFGRAVGAAVIELAKGITTKAPAAPSIAVIEDRFQYQSRINFENMTIRMMLTQAFFPEMAAMIEEVPKNTVTPVLVTCVLNKELALVGGSGEFFSAHAVRLKKESAAPETFFLGYCNGHQMYFPTREAIEEGGYGADSTVSWVSPGAGEEIIDRALQNIERLMK